MSMLDIKKDVRHPEVSRRRNQQHGTTLVEALITVSLFTLLFGAAIAVLLSSSDSWQTNSVVAELQQERRNAVEWMKMDLQQGGYSTITNVNSPLDAANDNTWYDTITFSTSNGVLNGSISWSSDTVNFALSGSPNYQLIRTSGASAKVIAIDIRTLQFKRESSDPDIVYVSITAQKNTLKGQTLTASTTFEVKMRN